MSENLGEFVKKIRSEQKMTLKELSGKTGLSISFLSQFERGLTTAALDSLMKIADALNTDVYDFVRETLADARPKDQIVLHSYQRPTPQVTSNFWFETDLSAYGKDKKMMARMYTLFPYTQEEWPYPYEHDGEEFIYVLEGILTLEVDHVKHTLYPEDTAHFSSSLKHIWYNETNQNVKFLIMNYPYYPNK